MAVGIPVYGGGVLPHRLAELLSIAFDASFTHMYVPCTRRHIKAALKAGATMEEIMEVLKLCVIQGIEAKLTRRYQFGEGAGARRDRRVAFSSAGRA